MTFTETSAASTTPTDDFDMGIDWETDEDEVLACGLENPEECEACQ